LRDKRSSGHFAAIGSKRSIFEISRVLPPFVGTRCKRFAEVSNHQLLVTLDPPRELYYASQRNKVSASVDSLSWPVR